MFEPEIDLDACIAFLGLSWGAAPVDPGQAELPSIAGPHAIVTISKAIASSIFPLQLAPYFATFAIRRALGSQEVKLTLMSPQGVKVITCAARLTMLPDDPLSGEWEMFSFPLAAHEQQILAAEPGRYIWDFAVGSRSCRAGSVTIGYVPSPPLSEDERRAIRSNPTAASVVRIDIGDLNCTSNSIGAYCALDREEVKDLPEVQGAIWYADLPDQVRQSDGTIIPLQYLRESMHAMLRDRPSVPNGQFQRRPLYAASELVSIISRFRDLLNTEPLEEEVQQYIAKNLVLLCPFAGQRVVLKPSILTKYKADFGVFSSRGALTLIEIERPSLRLFTRDGRRTAELEKPYDKVRSWLFEFNQDRAAALRCISGAPSQVTRVEGCVIAGRARPEENEYRARMLAEDSTIEFWTYDHLIARVEDTARHLGLAV